jgi:hypothetical protein
MTIREEISTAKRLFAAGEWEQSFITTWGAIITALGVNQQPVEEGSDAYHRSLNTEREFAKTLAPELQEGFLDLSAVATRLLKVKDDPDPQDHFGDDPVVFISKANITRDEAARAIAFAEKLTGILE